MEERSGFEVGLPDHKLGNKTAIAGVALKGI
jgi:hypothetical protein